MFDSQLQFERLEQVAEQYRRDAAQHEQRQLARCSVRIAGAQPLRHRFASLLRRMADAVEPTPKQPPLNV
jgi:hypothetical protein